MKHCSVCNAHKDIRQYMGKLYCGKHYQQMKRCGYIWRDVSEIESSESEYMLVSLYDKSNRVVGKALIDHEDVDKVKGYRWTLSNGRAIAHGSNDKTILMHRLILNFPEGIIDHINHNALDNRKSNLRACTRSENLKNLKVRATNTSGFSGISYSRERKRWQAYITHDYVRYPLGSFLHLEDAIVTRKIAEYIFFKDFRPIILRKDVDNLTYEELKTKYGYEKVYVIKTELAEKLKLQEGITLFSTEKLREITDNGFFIRRYNAEYNKAFKQVIPYVIIKHKEQVFAVRRISDKKGDERLFENISIGHAGHINEIDQMQIGSVISNAVVRELTEELDIYCNCTPHARYYGFINDNSNDVSRDHLGVIVLVDLSKPNVKVRETEKLMGDWVSYSWLRENYNLMESWSQKVFDVLEERIKG